MTLMGDKRARSDSRYRDRRVAARRHGPHRRIPRVTRGYCCCQTAYLGRVRLRPVRSHREVTPILHSLHVSR